MKRLVVKTGEYTNKNGEKKGQYQNIGRLMESNNGEFIILEPEFNLAGLLLKQNMMNRANGKEIKDGLMVSIFEDKPAGNVSVSNQPTGAVASTKDFDDDLPF